MLNFLNWGKNNIESKNPRDKKTRIIVVESATPELYIAGNPQLPSIKSQFKKAFSKLAMMINLVAICGF